MTWVKFDDSWYDNPKLFALEAADELLWMKSVGWAARHRTDGLVLAKALTFLGYLAKCPLPNEAAERLVNAGLWHLDPEGWRIHDYLVYQPARAHIEDVQAKRAEAGRLGGLAPRGQVKQTGKQIARQTALEKKNPVQSRPVPSSPGLTPPSSSSVRETDDDDDDRISKALEEIGRRKHRAALAAGKVRTNPARHEETCIASAHMEMVERVAAIARDPALSAAEIADRLQPDTPGLGPVSAARARQAQRKQPIGGER